MIILRGVWKKTCIFAQLKHSLSGSMKDVKNSHLQKIKCSMRGLNNVD